MPSSPVVPSRCSSSAFVSFSFSSTTTLPGIDRRSRERRAHVRVTHLVERLSRDAPVSVFRRARARASRARRGDFERDGGMTSFHLLAANIDACDHHRAVHRAHHRRVSSRPPRFRRVVSRDVPSLADPRAGRELGDDRPLGAHHRRCALGENTEKFAATTRSNNLAPRRHLQRRAPPGESTHVIVRERRERRVDSGEVRRSFVVAMAVARVERFPQRRDDGFHRTNRWTPSGVRGRPRARADESACLEGNRPRGGPDARNPPRRRARRPRPRLRPRPRPRPRLRPRAQSSRPSSRVRRRAYHGGRRARSKVVESRGVGRVQRGDEDALLRRRRVPSASYRCAERADERFGGEDRARSADGSVPRARHPREPPRATTPGRPRRTWAPSIGAHTEPNARRARTPRGDRPGDARGNRSAGDRGGRFAFTFGTIRVPVRRSNRRAPGAEDRGRAPGGVVRAAAAFRARSAATRSRHSRSRDDDARAKTRNRRRRRLRTTRRRTLKCRSGNERRACASSNPREVNPAVFVASSPFPSPSNPSGFFRVAANVEARAAARAARFFFVARGRFGRDDAADRTPPSQSAISPIKAPGPNVPIDRRAPVESTTSTRANPSTTSAAKSAGVARGPTVSPPRADQFELARHRLHLDRVETAEVSRSSLRSTEAIDREREVAHHAPRVGVPRHEPPAPDAKPAGRRAAVSQRFAPAREHQRGPRGVARRVGDFEEDRVCVSRASDHAPGRLAGR